MTESNKKNAEEKSEHTETESPSLILYDAWEHRFKSDDDYYHSND